MIGRTREEVQRIVAAVPAAEYAELCTVSTRGLRGFDGRVFASVMPVHNAVEEARGMAAEAARSVVKL